MPYFHNLSILDAHQQFLQKRSKNQNLFLVGGCIRDVLLEITKTPMDIDFTIAGDPVELYEHFDKSEISSFITEKFGTSTFIESSAKKEGYPADGEIEYQLTPLRTEGSYGDFRHPEEIQRSNDLILDSQRRDFSINAMYYFSLPTQRKIDLPDSTAIQASTQSHLETLLAKEGYVYLKDLNLLILQHHEYITKTFPNAKFDEVFCRYLIETAQAVCLTETKGNEDAYAFRILIDPQQGLQSLISRKLETVGDANQRFSEDALRVIRAIRIVNIMNTTLSRRHELLFDYTATTREAILRNVPLLMHVAKERIKDELTKAFQKGDPFNFVVLLETSGILAQLFPALFATIHVEQPIRYHAFDVYTHTMLALHALQEINTDYLVRFAMLYHDVGKVIQYAGYAKAKGDKEKIREIIAGPSNHRNCGPELMKTDFKALGFSNKEIETIARYISEHHTPGEILNANPKNREKKLRHLLSEKGFEMVDNLLDINIADRKGQFNPLQSSGDLTESYELKTILKKLNEEEGQFTMKDLLINGNDLIQKYGMRPGPLVGELLKALFDRVLNDVETRNTAKELEVFVKNWLKNRGESK